MRSGVFGDTICVGDDEIDVVVEWEGYYQRARTTGRWEDCYPEEGEIDIKVKMIGEWPEGLSEPEWNDLLDKNNERLIERAWSELYDQRLEYA